MLFSSSVFQIDAADNVAVALNPIKAGQPITFPNGTLIAVDAIAAGHKVALSTIAPGEAVIKYGYPIGLATKAIAPGQWVHSQNLKTALNTQGQYTYTPLSSRIPSVETGETFFGFLRPDGRVGIRNEVWLIPTVGCINPVVEKLVRLAGEYHAHSPIDGIHGFVHPYGCSQLDPDLHYTQNVLSGLVRHPNAGAVLVLGLGCENNHISAFRNVLKDYDPCRVRFINLQDVEDDIAESLAIIAELVAQAETDKRRPVPISRLVLGLKCGGSDGYSGITANPLLGKMADRVAGSGGTALLTEVPEMFGAETILMARAKDKAVFEQIVDLINGFKAYYQRYHQPVYENPSPGNLEGGITTLEEKSLGCIRKGGQAQVTAVLDYGACETRPGLNLVRGPGNDLVSTTALAAAGAQMVLFSTGRGTPLGGPVPTVKVASNSSLAQKKSGWIDFNAGQLLEDLSMDALSEALWSQIIQTASGEIVTQNEKRNYRQIAIFKDGVTL